MHSLKTTYDELRSNHPCLTSNNYPKFPNSGKPMATTNNTVRRTMEQRPRIGVRDLSREDIVRKDILCNLNKLSKSNVEAIIRSLRTSFYIDYFHHYVSITWDMMHKQHEFQPLFVMVLNNVRALLINPSDTAQFDLLLAQKCRGFLDEQGWLPPPSVLCEAPDYDEFCDYMKWKKKSQGILKAVLILMSSTIVEPNYEEVFENISDTLQNCGSIIGADIRTLECILEAILICARTIPRPSRHISDEWINHWIEQSEIWPKNAKFKMLDIRESLCKN
jgi:hypothetical protein